MYYFPRCTARCLYLLAEPEWFVNNLGDFDTHDKLVQRGAGGTEFPKYYLSGTEQLRCSCFLQRYKALDRRAGLVQAVESYRL